MSLSGHRCYGRGSGGERNLASAGSNGTSMTACGNALASCVAVVLVVTTDSPIQGRYRETESSTQARWKGADTENSGFAGLMCERSREREFEAEIEVVCSSGCPGRTFFPRRRFQRGGMVIRCAAAVAHFHPIV